jgi:hypothetical protein
MKAIDQLSSLLRQFNSMSTPLGIIAGKSSSIANLRARLRRAAADRAVVVQESSKAGLGSLMISEAFATSAEEVIRYIITKLPRNKHERKLELSLGITKNGNLGIRITGDTMQAQPIGNVNLLPDIYDAVAGDSSPEVLGLLFSAEVLAANGGALQLIAEGDSVRVALEMPILESDNARIGD